MIARLQEAFRDVHVSIVYGINGKVEFSEGFGSAAENKMKKHQRNIIGLK